MPVNDGTKISTTRDGMARVLHLDFSDGTRLEVRAWDDDERLFSEILEMAAKRVKLEEENEA
jgi:hypothetical protein